MFFVIPFFSFLCVICCFLFLSDLFFTLDEVEKKACDGNCDKGCKQKQRGIGGEGKKLVVKFPHTKSPAGNRKISCAHHDRHVNPELQAEHKADYRSDQRAGHPEGEQNEDKKAGYAVSMDPVLVCLSRLSDTRKYAFEPGDLQEVPPGEYKKRIKGEGNDGFHNHIDRNNGEMAEARCVAERHSGGPAKNHISSGHSDDGVRHIRKPYIIRNKPP